MWRAAQVGLWLACAAALPTGCGRVTFGTDLTQDDADAEVDAGAPDRDAPDAEPDAEVVDVGPTPDGGCIELTPPGYPEDWPFEATSSGYNYFFWTWAAEQGCNAGGLCHGNAQQPPYIPTAAQLGDRWGEGVAALWPLVRDSAPLPPEGALWRHHPDHVDHIAPVYTDGQTRHLRDLRRQGHACQVGTFQLQARDAGPLCEAPEEVDAGPPDSGEAEDAGSDEDGAVADGALDAGRPRDTGPADSGASEPCLCPLPDAGPLAFPDAGAPLCLNP